MILSWISVLIILLLMLLIFLWIYAFYSFCLWQKGGEEYDRFSKAMFLSLSCYYKIRGGALRFYWHIFMHILRESQFYSFVYLWFLSSSKRERLLAKLPHLGFDDNKIFCVLTILIRLRKHSYRPWKRRRRNDSWSFNEDLKTCVQL